ncbi:hypothetical protein [uncultured Paracoccus sp.]|uniref:hypothetical protein n=1 Tax=uncultured Paracoccus sp. TaxID=189685 RepID=UPI00260E320B|nr:hypothetical protein [uncultured Paracoccus sp.]
MRNLHLLKQTLSQARQASGTRQFNGAWPPLTIDAMLERLTALSADHFERSPEDVNWGDVGTLEHYRARLREITDMAFREGEHAN